LSEFEISGLALLGFGFLHMFELPMVWYFPGRVVHSFRKFSKLPGFEAYTVQGVHDLLSHFICDKWEFVPFGTSLLNTPFTPKGLTRPYAHRFNHH
jgi:hypothetical protein